ncbi:MAG: lysophospholipid acyltransferase family protein [Bacteroidota bacterium]
MLYNIVRPVARIWLKACFRKIHLHQAELIPTDKPVILAANHPTAFIEPCILATNLPMPLNFIVRGDLFAKPFYTKLLKSLNMVPIFRLKDGGYKKLKNNYDTFTFCYEALRDQKTIMILAEGTTRHEKRLRPLRKGTARIVFGALESQGELDIHIVPVGVNYTYADQLRKEAMIEFGKPIRVLDYWEEYKQEPNQATRKLLEELRKRLEKRVIIIDNPTDDSLVEQLFVVYRNDRPQRVWPLVVRNNDRLMGEKRIANWINKLQEVEKERVVEKVQTYYRALEKHQVADLGVAQSWQANWRNTLILVLGFFPFLLGLIGNYLPYSIANGIVRKKVRAVEFKLSVWLAAGMVLYLLYWLVLLLLGLMIEQPIYWAFWAMLPFWGFFAFLYAELLAKWRQAKQFRSLAAAVQSELRQKRAGLSSLIDGQMNKKTTSEV